MYISSPSLYMIMSYNVSYVNYSIGQKEAINTYI